MTRGGKPVRAHSGVITLFIYGFSGGSEADDHISGTDIRAVDHVCAAQPAENGGIGDDSPYKIADIRSLASGKSNIYSVSTQNVGAFLISADYALYHGAGNTVRVSPYRIADHKASGSSDAEQIVDIHNE
ncbi:hypothetical protein SDC9_94853 [bioreactor metagenome]|uniref:Uncharacterized protein n=1 Tax=bioreactor metagenome TaxID=1076179 RepID=A0A645A762_9ZZZZ